MIVRLLLMMFIAITASTTQAKDAIDDAKEAYFLALQIEQQQHDNFIVSHTRIASELEQQWGNPAYHQGTLAFNIANSWLHAKRYGKSIYWYQHALRQGYDGPAVYDNIRLAQNQRLDDLPLWFDHAALQSARTLVLSPNFDWAVKGLFAVMLFMAYRWITLRTHGRATVGIMVTVMTLFALSNGMPYLTSNGVIIQPETIGRKGPSEVFAPTFKHPLHDGTEFIALQKEQDWVFVRLSNQQYAWLKQQDIALY